MCFLLSVLRPRLRLQWLTRRFLAVVAATWIGGTLPAAAQFDNFLDSVGDSIQKRLEKELDDRINPEKSEDSSRPETAPLPSAEDLDPQPRAEPAPTEPKATVRGDIASIQQNLNALGYDAGPVDGLMGSRTRGAILAWQRDSGLRPTGRPTRQVQNQLEAAVATASSQTPALAGQPEVRPEYVPSGVAASRSELAFSLDRREPQSGGRILMRIVGRTPTTETLYAHVVARGDRPQPGARGTQVVHARERTDVMLRTPEPGAHDVLVLKGGGQEVARLPITVAGDQKAPASSHSAGGVVAQIKQSSPEHLVLRATGIRHDLSGLDITRASSRLNHMLMRVAAGLVRDPAGWGEKLYAFLPLLDRAERKDIFTRAVSDRPVQVYTGNQQLHAYLASQDWLPDPPFLASHLNRFESRALQSLLAGAWPSIASQAIRLPLKVRRFCTVQREEYNFARETWYFSRKIPGASCARVADGTDFTLEGNIAFDAFELDVTMDPTRAQQLYNTLEVGSSGRANGFDVIAVDLTVNGLELSSKTGRGMRLMFDPGQVEVQGLRMYANAELNPVAWTFKREPIEARPVSPSSLSTAPLEGGGLVEVRWDGMSKTKPPRVQYACVERSELPAAYNDPTQYLEVAARPFLVDRGSAVARTYRDTAFVVTKDCLPAFKQAIRSVGLTPGVFLVRPVSRGTAGQVGPDASDVGAGHDGTLVSARAARSDIVEIRWNDAPAGNRVALYYYCLERKDLPEAVFDPEMYITVAKQPLPRNGATGTIAMLFRGAAFATTGECLAEIQQQIGDTSLDPNNFSVTRIGTLSRQRSDAQGAASGSDRTLPRKNVNAEPQATTSRQAIDMVEVSYKRIRTDKRLKAVAFCTDQSEIRSLYGDDGNTPFVTIAKIPMKVETVGGFVDMSKEDTVYVLPRTCLPEMLEGMQRHNVPRAEFEFRQPSAGRWDQ